MMYDLHLLEADVLERKLDPDTSALVLQELYLKVFDIHNITPGQFQKSYDYYVHHPNEFQAVYEAVLNRLSRGEEEVILE